MKKEEILGSKYLKYLCEVLCVFFAIIIIAFIFVVTIRFRGAIIYAQSYFEMDSGWKLVRANTHVEEVQLPVTQAAIPREVLVVENTLPHKLTGKESLSFRAIGQNINVYIGNELRESYYTSEEYFIWRNPISKYIYVSLSSADAGKEIRIEGVSPTGSKRTFSKVYCGERSALVNVYMRSQLIGIILAMTFFALGIVSILAGYLLRLVSKHPIHLDAIGWAMFMVSLWDFTQSDFRDFVFSEVSAVHALPVFTLFIIPLFISIYFDWIQGERFYKIHRAFQFACIVAVILSGILVLNKILSPDDLVGPSFIFLYGEFVIIVVTSVLDKKENKSINYIDVLVGCGAVAVGGVLQIFNFFFFPQASDGLFLSMGFAILTLTGVANSLRSIIRMQGERQAAVTAADLKSQFLATMSHEIRTPINAIMGMNEAIIRESNEDHIVSYANDVENAGKLLLYLVNDILDFSKLESGKMTLVYAAYSVKQLVSKCYNIVNGKVKENGLDIIIEVDENVPSVLYGDEVRIQQVMINLLNNAVKYTDSGEVTLRIASTQLNKESVDLKIEVSDTGRGIKEENLGTLFDAFTRTQDAADSRVEGTGLGLAITSKFVNLMEGSISVQSHYGEGSTFTVIIPQRIISENPVGKFSVNDEEIVEKPKTDADIIKFPGIKLLVVDDVQLNIKVVMSLLKKAEMEIDSATSGDDCLEKCKDTKYDVILLDHMMPGKDGIQTLWELRRDKKSINNETPVIMMTANAMNGAREEYMGLGFSDYVSKPFNLTQLQKIIQKNLKNK
ncbi:MAG: response regulator [Lachnospiraceae bacterium]|nr:response regulator [Lachnospiraceae bacterium]